jgi:hypothetical protein
VPIEEAPDHRQRETLTAVGDQQLPDFQQCDIRLAADETQQIIAMRLNSARPLIPARRSRRNKTRGLEAPNPAYGAGDADPKMLGRRIAGHAVNNDCAHDAHAKIIGKRHHPPPP